MSQPDAPRTQSKPKAKAKLKPKSKPKPKPKPKPKTRPLSAQLKKKKKKKKPTPEPQAKPAAAAAAAAVGGEADPSPEPGADAPKKVIQKKKKKKKNEMAPLDAKPSAASSVTAVRHKKLKNDKKTAAAAATGVPGVKTQPAAAKGKGKPKGKVRSQSALAHIKKKRAAAAAAAAVGTTPSVGRTDGWSGDDDVDHDQPGYTMPEPGALPQLTGAFARYAEQPGAHAHVVAPVSEVSVEAQPGMEPSRSGVAAGVAAVVGAGQFATLLDASASAQEQKLMEVDGPVRHVATMVEPSSRHISSVTWLDGSLLATASNNDGIIKFYDWRTCTCVRSVESSGPSPAICALPYKQLLAAASFSGDIELWNLQTFALAGKLSGHRKAVNCLASRAEGVLVSGGSDKTVRTWDVVANKMLSQTQGFDAVLSIAALPDGRIAAGCFDGGILVLDPDGHRNVISLEVSERGVACVGALSNTALVAASFGPQLTSWNLSKREKTDERTLAGSASCLCTVIHPHSGVLLLMTGCTNGTLQLWDPSRQGAPLAQWKGHDDFVSTIAASPKADGFVATCSSDGSTRVWQIS